VVPGIRPEPEFQHLLLCQQPGIHGDNGEFYVCLCAASQFQRLRMERRRWWRRLFRRRVWRRWRRSVLRNCQNLEIAKLFKIISSVSSLPPRCKGFAHLSITPPITPPARVAQAPPAALESCLSPANTRAESYILVTQRNYYGREHAQQLRYPQF
jgi:hypothetical protein